MFYQGAGDGVSEVATDPQHGDSLPLFEQEWWLTAATLGGIERTETHWDNVVVGSLWYLPIRRGFIKKVALPPFTRVLSPRLLPPPAGPSVDMRNRVRIIKDLFEPLQRFDSYHTVIQEPSSLGFAFQINDFKVSSKYTFVSDAAVPMTAVHGAIHQKTRNLVKSGRDYAGIEFHTDLDRFRRLSAVRSRRDHTDYRALTSLWEAIEKRGAGTLISAVGAADEDLCCAVLVWDERRLYFLVSARGASLEANKAYALMFYESIALAKRMRRAFDADGFATIDSARSLMKWGLPVSMNLNVNRGSLSYNTIKPLKDKFIPAAY